MGSENVTDTRKHRNNDGITDKFKLTREASRCAPQSIQSSNMSLACLASESPPALPLLRPVTFFLTATTRRIRHISAYLMSEARIQFQSEQNKTKNPENGLGRHVPPPRLAGALKSPLQPRNSQE